MSNAVDVHTMLSLISLALALTLVASAVAVSRVDAVDHRVALVVVAVVLAVGGATAQVTPTESPASAIEAAATENDDPTQLAAAESTHQTATGGTTAAATNATNATVLGVGDGGRITYRTAEGVQRTVRLAGLDLPSAGGADPARFDGVLTGSRGRTCLAQQGRRALVETRMRLVGESVSVQSEGKSAATVHVNGHSLNRQLVDRGDARATSSEYTDAERSARSARLGVWSCAVVEPTPPLREANTSNVRIAAVHPNPPGDDAASLTDEYVVIENAGERTVDLSDWYLVDGDEKYYFFGDRSVRPGEELVVRIGSGRDTDGVVYWGASSPVLDNDHETLKLVDGDTDRTVRVAY